MNRFWVMMISLILFVVGSFIVFNSVAWGSEAAIRRRIQAHFDAGASHVCIQPLHPDGRPLPDYDALDVLAD